MEPEKKEEVFKFLDELRLKNEHMHDKSHMLTAEFGLSRNKATKLLVEWMAESSNRRQQLNG